MYYVKTRDGDTYGPFESHNEAYFFSDSCLIDVNYIVTFSDSYEDSIDPDGYRYNTVDIDETLWNEMVENAWEGAP